MSLRAGMLASSAVHRCLSFPKLWPGYWARSGGYIEFKGSIPPAIRWAVDFKHLMRCVITINRDRRAARIAEAVADCTECGGGIFPKYADCESCTDAVDAEIAAEHGEKA